MIRRRLLIASRHRRFRRPHRLLRHDRSEERQLPDVQWLSDLHPSKDAGALPRVASGSLRRFAQLRHRRGATVATSSGTHVGGATKGFVGRGNGSNCGKGGRVP